MLEKKGGCSKRLVVERKNVWNDICQSKHPSFKIWKRHGNGDSQYICRIYLKLPPGLHYFRMWVGS